MIQNIANSSFSVLAASNGSASNTAQKAASSATHVVMPSATEQDTRLTTILSEHVSAAFNTADQAMFTVQNELKKIDKVVSTQRPDLAGRWDFTMKDGKLSVVGDGLSSADKKDIEKQLNGDKALVSAAQSLMNAAVTRYETSKDNPTMSAMNAYTGQVENHTYYKVADQLNGKVNLRDLVSKTKAYLQFDSIHSPASNLRLMGSGSMDVIASQLKSSGQGIDMNGFTFDASAGTVSRS